MSLFVKVNTSFYTHRKTARLKARIGTDAYWLPPRLWAYAAEYHPDGKLDGYNPEELASLLNYMGNAQAMLEAMLQAGFLDKDPLRIHDWSEHNSYHSTFAERAKTAADARWQKERSKEKESTREEKRGEETSIASSMLQACEGKGLALPLFGVSIEPPKNPSAELRAAAILILLFLNTRAGRRFEAKDETLRPIMKRLAEGYSPEEIKKMIDREVAIQGGLSKWLQTSTLFGVNFATAYADRELPNPTKNPAKPNPRNSGFSQTDTEHGAAIAAALKGKSHA